MRNNKPLFPRATEEESTPPKKPSGGVLRMLDWAYGRNLPSPDGKSSPSREGGEEKSPSVGRVLYNHLIYGSRQVAHKHKHFMYAGVLSNQLPHQLNIINTIP